MSNPKGPVVGEILDPEEEALMIAREAELEEEDRLGLLRPVEELIADLRAEFGQRRAG
jgi:hypothetical protein